MNRTPENGEDPQARCRTDKSLRGHSRPLALLIVGAVPCRCSLSFPGFDKTCGRRYNPGPSANQSVSSYNAEGIMLNVSFESLAIGVDGSIGRIVLNRPQRLNAMNSTMLRELVHAAH